MMTGTSKVFVVVREAEGFSTRPAGRAARQSLLARLEVHDEVDVDLGSVPLTPSFADELIGGLLTELGTREFKRRVHLINVPVSARFLLKNVLNNRVNTGQAQESHGLAPV